MCIYVYVYRRKKTNIRYICRYEHFSHLISVCNRVNTVNKKKLPITLSPIPF